MGVTHMERFYKLLRETTNINAEIDYDCHVRLINGESFFSNVIRVECVRGDRMRPTFIHYKAADADTIVTATFDKNNKLSSLTTICNQHTTTYIIIRSKDNIIEEKYIDGMFDEGFIYLLDDNGYIVFAETYSNIENSYL